MYMEYTDSSPFDITFTAMEKMKMWRFLDFFYSFDLLRKVQIWLVPYIVLLKLFHSYYINIINMYPIHYFINDFKLFDDGINVLSSQ